MAAFKSKALQIVGDKTSALLGQKLYARTFNGFQTQSIRPLSLAYALHEPPRIESFKSGREIIIMHGLFGSKQNSRSISKYGSLCTLHARTTLKRLEKGTGSRPEKAGICFGNSVLRGVFGGPAAYTVRICEIMANHLMTLSTTIPQWLRM